MANQLAEIVATHLAHFRAGFGTQIMWQSNTYAARIVEPQRRQFEFLAEGLGINAAASDVRYVMLTPSDFTDAAYPLEGDEIVLSGESVLTFRVLRRWIRAIGGVSHTVQLLIYRQASPDASTDAATSEPGAGARKQYWP